MLKRRIAVVGLVLAGWVFGASTEEQGLRGFARDEVAAQRDREAKFRAIPNPENLREYMKATSAEPHHAGSPGSRKVAEYILARFKSWGLNAWIEEYEALMPTPTERIVELVAPETFRASLREPQLTDDPDSGDDGQLPTYNAYSADGDVTAELVYVNYGTPEDYERLQKIGVDVKGRIVIARYGRSWRGIKPKVAAEHGAVACIIYSDPREDGYFQGDTYPGGSWRPEYGAQRGSVMDMPVYPGDPLSPGWGSEKGSRRLDRSDAVTLVKIPVLPISYADALPMLRNLKGPVAPQEWRGALPITYHVGPGPAKVRVKLAFDWQTRPLYNVMARIDGAEFPDEWIVHGNHHDAWVNGAEDPTSGNVSLLETARGFAQLVKEGWKPKRTILFASWDGEEWGLLGSTEWAEKHAQELRDKAVAYVNSDSTGRGWLSVAGSHSLQALVNAVSRDVDGPRTPGAAGDRQSVFDQARTHAIEEAESDEDKKKIRDSPDLPIDAMGSGSDYTPFIDHLAIASLTVSFTGDADGGIYHSIYDSFNWYSKYSDGDFTHGRALSQTIGTILLRFSEASVLPFQFIDYERAISEYVDEIEREHKKMPDAPALNLSPVRAALNDLRKAANGYERAIARVGDTPKAELLSRRDTLKALNRLLFTTERTLGYDKGLPKREWFKHLIYAPGLYTGYGVKTLPGIREGMEQKQWDDARAFVPIVADALRNLARQVNDARQALEDIL